MLTSEYGTIVKLSRSNPSCYLEATLFCMAKQHFYCFSREAIKAPLILGKKSRKAEGQGRVGHASKWDAKWRRR